ncbi:hypothetical protein AXG93_131s1310 [Marchantia polymorpha subsp. ruderalis]|uniref:Uncharacterized protein n=1 Tax=Marchantia polymorpha subsp. ruderalis TaxID=1480154 RepID=A0A176W1I5_MARPO|nr:hypothetical protein AXG93_131s1310 [Marchantia polymorpha subsp. ruderalis]
MQLAEVESSCRARGELAARVTRCLNGYTHWEVAAQERVTLRESLQRSDAWGYAAGRKTGKVVCVLLDRVFSYAVDDAFGGSLCSISGND